MSKQQTTIKPTLKEPFPDIPEVWVCPKTGLEVPKRHDANLQYRLDLLEKAEHDEGMQKDLLAACIESQLFFVNTFGMTFHQFDVGKDGRRIESPNPDMPMITWLIQDELLTRFENCIAIGEDILIDKSRDMGASWCCVFFMHWLMLFRQKKTELLEMSRNEDYVDKAGNMKALFQKHDRINMWLPDWMRPPDCFLGQANRTHMHWHNPITTNTLDGESTTKHALRGDRRLVAMLDEFGAVQAGASMRGSSRDAALVRIINSTSVPGSEYNKWRSDGTIKVFIMPYWEHPDKGRGRHLKQTNTGKWEIRSPWLDLEEKVRGPKYIATEVLREDVEPGLSFFVVENIDKHIAMYGRPPKSTWDIRFKKHLGYEDTAEIIRHRDRSMLVTKETPAGPLKLWCDIKDGRPDQTKSYIFGIDVSKGQSASNSVISIKCKETGEKVGEWADATYPAYELSLVVVALALWFGGPKPWRLAFLKWEKNNPGWDLGRILVKKYFYPYYYREETPGKTVDKKTMKYGFHTSRQSKYELFSLYDRMIAHGGYINRSIAALEEARMYVHLPNGGIGPIDLMHESNSAQKTHGDRAMADALTLEDKEIPKAKLPSTTIKQNSVEYRFRQHIRSKRIYRKQGKRRFNFAVAH